MTTLKDILSYILNNYPQHMRDELSNARITKMIYLADWHQAINHGKQLTNIRWYFDNYGPYVDDIRSAAESAPELFKVINTNNMYGQPKIMISSIDDEYVPQLSSNAIKSLDHVIQETQKMYWAGFIKLVYSTYPIVTSDRYSYLDLVSKAAEYKQSRI